MNTQPHVAEDALEAYALGALEDGQLDAVENHLLVCERCRTHLEDVESYVLAAKTAAARLRTEDRLFPAQPKNWWERLLVPVLARPVFAVASAGVLGLFLLSPVISRHPNPYQEISLQSIRGPSAPASQSSSGMFRLRLDLQGLPAESAYHVTLVNSTGKTIWDSTLRSNSSTPLIVEIPEKLTPATYWVRLHSAANGHRLLREYPLQIQ